ncbi:MAG: hypothetical protein HY235_21315 [Acidobacteria bacterium]|nr:hypothetical protein [Acidobacteriota bacterium]
MADKNESKPLFSAPVVLFGVLAVAAGVGIWYLENTSGNPPRGPVLTSEAKAYVANLQLADVEMKATENAIHQQVVEITGNITNNGDRFLRSVQVHCVFHDPYGLLVLRERIEIVRARQGGLKPGETRPFRLPFDSLPQSWNQRMPQLVIAQILFG